MLSHIVTAAKGLFSAQDPAEEGLTSPAHDERSTTLPERPKNMVSTRRTRYGTAEPEGSSNTKTSPVGSGKRKTRSIVPNGTENQAKKRRTIPEGDSAIAVVVNGTRDTGRNDTINEEAGSSDWEDASDTSVDANSKSPGGVTIKSTHMRFGSEDPIPVEQDAGAVSETKESAATDDESSDDDEAPETFDNSAQLANMKAAMQNAEQAKLRHEQLKKEKRKERDQRLKSQAISKKSKELLNGGGARTRAPEQDDMMSESTATLQDSGFKDPRYVAGTLPALLPDEILNAEPVSRLPTPVSENDKSKPRISRKRKFLDEEQKLPKDVRRGNTTIRVLDGSSGKTNSLAPRTSKAGKHVRENWLSGNRSGANTGGLRRTTGTSKGFVRKG